MIKPSVMKRFLKQYIIPEFGGFFIHKADMLLRVSAIFVHGIYFQRSQHDDGSYFYVHPFLEFLTDGTDTVGFTIGGQTSRLDKKEGPSTLFRIEPPEKEAEEALRAMRASPYYAHVLRPTFRSLLETYSDRTWPVWIYHGLACCAVMEGEKQQAEVFFHKFLNQTEWLKDSWAGEPREFVELMLGRLSNLDSCREFLWKRAEEGIRLKKLEKIAELSGWRPGE